MNEELEGTVVSIIYESADGYTVAEIEAEEPTLSLIHIYTFDEYISRYIKKKYNMLIGERTAEEIKINIGKMCIRDRY